MVEEHIQTNAAAPEGENGELQQKEEGATDPQKNVALSGDEQESAESFSDPEIAALLERSFANVEEGRIVRGHIVQIHDSDLNRRCPIFSWGFSSCEILCSRPPGPGPD